jgi:hypothetical protein
MTSPTALTASIYNQMFYVETLANETLTTASLSGTWAYDADFADGTNKGTYTHSTGAGTLTQNYYDMDIPGRSMKLYDFTYTVSSPSDTAPTIVITADFALVETALVGLDTAGTYTVRFRSAVTPGNFVLSGTSDAAGAVTIDTLSLKEVLEDGNTIQPKSALISVETATLTFTIDGTTPTIAAESNHGHQLTAESSYVLDNITSIRNFRCINTAASSGSVLKVTYFY